MGNNNRGTRLFGEPIANSQFGRTLLGVPSGLSVEAPDATSSVAYAWEAMAFAAVAAGISLQWTLWLTIAVIAVILAVGTGYTFLIRSFPQGGGAYMVARSMLGIGPSLVVAGALLVDYNLTVAVSTSSAVFQLTSQVSFLRPFTVALCVAAIGIIVFLNLRGIHNLAAILRPVLVLFLGSMFMLVVVGEYRFFTGSLQPIHQHPQVAASGTPGLWALLIAFASGCVALTGLESISDGVQIFKEPKSLNARKAMWALILVIVTITFPFAHLAVTGNVHVGDVSAIVQVSSMVFAGFPTIGGVNVFALLPPLATAVILFMAVQTSFSSAPQLMSVLAVHGFMPRQFTDRSSRMVFHWGIGLVGIASAALLVLYGGNTQALIPLYSIGVFMAFTLALFGLLLLLWRKRQISSLSSLIGQLVVVGIAFLAAAIVLAIEIGTKIGEGAWITLVAIAVLVLVMSYIQWHYRRAQGALEQIPQPVDIPLQRKIVLLVGPIDARLGVMLQKVYNSGATKDQIRIVHVSPNEGARQEYLRLWNNLPIGKEFGIRVLIDEYRDVGRRVREYVEKNHVVGEDYFEIVLCQTAYEGFFDGALHHHMGASLQKAVIGIPGVSVNTVHFVPNIPRDPWTQKWLGAIFQGPTGRIDEAVTH